MIFGVHEKKGPENARTICSYMQIWVLRPYRTLINRKVKMLYGS